MVDVAIFQLDIKVKISADSSPPRHAAKVHRGDPFELDVDCRFVNKDEALVQRVEKTVGGSI